MEKTIPRGEKNTNWGYKGETKPKRNLGKRKKGVCQGEKSTTGDEITLAKDPNKKKRWEI